MGIKIGYPTIFDGYFPEIDEKPSSASEENSHQSKSPVNHD